jgi:hypothetical protein
MSDSKPWANNWTETKPLSGGGQGDTILVCSVQDKNIQAVLKLLKQGKSQDPKARRRMFQEVNNLKILRAAGAKVPEVLEHRNVQPVAQSMTLHFNEMQARLQKHRDSFYLLQNNNTQFFFEKLNGKAPQGDLVAGTKFGCGAHNHDFFLQIQYIVIAQGAECTFYRKIEEGHFHIQSPLKEIDPPFVVLHYQGDTNLSQFETSLVVADMEKAVARAIILISQRIQSS